MKINRKKKFAQTHFLHLQTVWLCVVQLGFKVLMTVHSLASVLLIYVSDKCVSGTTGNAELNAPPDNYNWMNIQNIQKLLLQHSVKTLGALF
jgi:hypothetical protein